MELTPLTALSPLDGRYRSQTEVLANYLSEYSLIKHRLKIEIKWLIYLIAKTIIPITTSGILKKLGTILENFSLSDAQSIKLIEQKTKHDVKAIEYYLKTQFEKDEDLNYLLPFIHFACTSEDINNLSYMLMLKEALNAVIFPALEVLVSQLNQIAHQYANLPMLGRTHGQPATPTTLGKEMANFKVRLAQEVLSFTQIKLLGKFNGAIGNLNAHRIAYPEIDWLTLSSEFIQSLELEPNLYTTQIEPNDRLAELLHQMIRINNICLALTKDCWGYISLGYFRQKAVSTEIGSSTMPHKINPIDFENAEGNLGIANALADHLANKLPISRWQRDLSGSTVLRNLGSIFGYVCLAYQSLARGLNKIEANPKFIEAELEEHWEILAEAVQTILRRNGQADAYETLKKLTRGKTLNRATFEQLIDQLPIPATLKITLKKLSPHTYLGYAEELAIKTYK